MTDARAFVYSVLIAIVVVSAFVGINLLIREIRLG